MEEDILEIISENYFEEIPREITAYVFKFIKWIILKAQRGEISINPATIIFKNKVSTLEEVYQDWKDNIKDK